MKIVFEIMMIKYFNGFQYEFEYIEIECIKKVLIYDTYAQVWL